LKRYKRVKPFRARPNIAIQGPFFIWYGMIIFGRRFLILIFCLFMGTPARAEVGVCREILSLIWQSRFSTNRNLPGRDDARLALYYAQVQALNATAALNPTLPRTMDAVFWNTNKGYRSGWGADIRGLLERNDLAFFQEVRLSPRNLLDLRSSGHYWSMGLGYFSGQDIPNGVATGARAKPLKATALRSPQTEPFVKVNKAILATEYNIQGMSKTFLNINVHSINFVSLKAYSNQLEQAGPIIDSHYGPVLLGGDANIWSLARREKMDQFAERHGLKKILFPVPGFMELDIGYYKGLDIEEADIVEDVNSSDHKPRHTRFTVQN
jgi:endonuclease/exonuclease/phosphatase (EEP) superfamily protein YafD